MKKREEFKTVTFYIDKGGSAKTTNTFNYVKNAVSTGDVRALVIDGDRSRNLTNVFGVNGKKTIADLFKSDGEDFEIYPTNDPKIDIIVGDSNFTDEGVNIRGASSPYLVLFTWYSMNYKMLSDKYDLIVIDTHNDTSIVTSNLIAVSDIVVSVTTPDGPSFTAWRNLPDFIEKIKTKARNPFTKETVVDLKIGLIANNIIFYGNNVSGPSKEFLSLVENDEHFLGLIPNRPIFVSTLLEGKSIFELVEDMPTYKKTKYQSLIDGVKEIYEKINAMLDWLNKLFEINI